MHALQPTSLHIKVFAIVNPGQKCRLRVLTNIIDFHYYQDPNEFNYPKNILTTQDSG